MAKKRILLAGAEKARAVSCPFMGRLRHAVGLRNLADQGNGPAAAKAKVARPSFKQYREKDGQFYFKLQDAKGALLLQSKGFASPRDAGRAIGELQQQPAAALKALASQLEALDNAAMRTVVDALEVLAEASDE